MAESEWEPLFDDLKAARSPDVLYEKVTPWLRNALGDWIDQNTQHREQNRRANRYPNARLLQDIETSCHLTLSWEHSEFSASSSLKAQAVTSDTVGLEVSNYLLSRSEVTSQAAARLDEILRNALSVWEVVPEGEGRPRRLQRRVSQQVAHRFEDVSSRGRAGEHLRNAWAAMYGREPEASTAFRESVKAVEAAGAPILTPDDPLSTLGKMIAAFRDKPEKWNVPLGSTPEDGRQTVLEMMKGVWHGQHDRHGSPDEERPLSVSDHEAEAALHTALTLVHLFQSGLVARG